ncbi:unnamed protein product [Lampetra fluviatilis]
MESLLRVELGTNSARPLGAAAGGGCISAGQSYETGRGHVFTKSGHPPLHLLTMPPHLLTTLRHHLTSSTLLFASSPTHPLIQKPINPSHCCLFVQPRWLRSLQPRRCSLGWSPLADGANPLSERVWRSRHSSQPSPCVASP